MSRVRIGCCGWCVKGGRKTYFEKFNVTEVQSTFYKLPRPQTASKWAEEAVGDFEFTMKAWQAITHPPSSPTWRKAGIRIPKSKADRYGLLKPTEENFEAWEKTLEICRAMKAKVCVVQTPASFKHCEENIRNVEEFFSTINREDVLIGWEPRGDWKEHLDDVKKLCDKLDLIHVVDPFRVRAVSSHEIAYFRLHGIGKGEVNYRYRYSDADLKRLRNIVLEELENRKKVYVLFNNLWMAEDASRFKEIISASRR